MSRAKFTETLKSEHSLSFPSLSTHTFARDLLLSKLFPGTDSPPRLAHLTVLECIGTGGSGVVFAAYDERLDRKVAVKILRRDIAHSSSQWPSRLLREARVLAQLSHPNVITVHEVGEHEQSIYIVMEFVRGLSLEHWLTQPSQARPWSEILHVFEQAGRGLEAAHRAGIAHRDFKPQNVMVREDGVIKVLDFGLARPIDNDSLPLDTHDASLDLAAKWTSSLTLSGTIIGTPAYMAPEQYLGERGDQRSDQFSFCVSLYQGLFQQHPFPAESPATLATAYQSGHTPKPPPTDVPSNIVQAILKGLSIAPSDRHSSLGALLHRLQYEPPRPKRQPAFMLGSSVALGIALALVGASAVRSQTINPCEHAGDPLGAVWGPHQQQELHRAFDTTALPYAQDAKQRVDKGLQAYSSRWTDIRKATCTAHRDGLESTHLYDLRVACLDQRRRALSTLVDVLSHATSSDVEHALEAIEKLPSPTDCENTTALLTGIPGGEPTTQVPEYARVRGDLQKAKTLSSLGRYTSALETVQRIIQTPWLSEHRVLQAEAQLTQGTILLAAGRYNDADASLHQSLLMGLELGHSPVAAESFARWIFTQGRTGGAEVAQASVPLAHALVERADNDHFRWLLLNNIATIQMASGQFETSIASLQQALEIHARIAPQPDLTTAATLSNLALAMEWQGHFDEAVGYVEQSLAITGARLGLEHPETQRLAFDIGRLEFATGKIEAAKTRMHSALRELETQLGPQAEPLLTKHLMLAELALESRTYETAAQHAELARTIMREHQLDAHAYDVFVGATLAEAWAGLGNHQRALEELERLLDQHASEPKLASLLDRTRGIVYLQLKHPAKALVAFTQAGEVPSIEPRAQATSHRRRSTCLRELGRISEAHQQAEQSLHLLLDIAPHDTKGLALARLELGEVLAAQGLLSDALEQFEIAHRDFAVTASAQHPLLGLLALRAAQVRLRQAPSEAHTSAELASRILSQWQPGFSDELASAQAILTRPEKSSH